MLYLSVGGAADGNSILTIYWCKTSLPLYKRLIFFVHVKNDFTNNITNIQFLSLRKYYIKGISSRIRERLRNIFCIRKQPYLNEHIYLQYETSTSRNSRAMDDSRSFSAWILVKETLACRSSFCSSRTFCWYRASLLADSRISDSSLLSPSAATFLWVE